MVIVDRTAFYYVSTSLRDDKPSEHIRAYRVPTRNRDRVELGREGQPANIYPSRLNYALNSRVAHSQRYKASLLPGKVEDMVSVTYPSNQVGGSVSRHKRYSK